MVRSTAVGCFFLVFVGYPDLVAKPVGRLAVYPRHGCRNADPHFCARFAIRFGVIGDYPDIACSVVPLVGIKPLVAAGLAYFFTNLSTLYADPRYLHGVQYAILY